MKTLNNKRNKLKNLIKEHIRKVLLKEGMQVIPNTYLSMYEDNVILTQSQGGMDSDTGQKVEISLRDLPKVIDAIFNTVPVNYFPVNYRQSIIAKLSDKAINQETDLGAEKPDDELEGSKNSKKKSSGGGDTESAEEETPEGGDEEETPAGENPFA
jgi:hypothetical protein